MRLSFALVVAASLASAEAVAQTYTFDGNVPANGRDFFYVPFDVPAGTAEIEVRHADLSSNNILDWGLDDADGNFRGWGGGNSEAAVVGTAATSRSYLLGPVTPGTWNVVVGKAKIVDAPGQYHVEVFLRTTASLPAQTERAAYAAATPLEALPRWYAGDLHVHSKESGDASPSLDEVATLAESRGLDFVILTDHNTVSQSDFVNAVQPNHPALLLIPGIEFTTYYGHANAIGATTWVNHRMGEPGVSIEASAQAVLDQGAIFSINHPKLDLGNICIGCAWKLDLPASYIGGVEIANGGWSEAGNLFDLPAIAFWEAVLDSGSHAVALGGSDDHSAGVGEGTFGSPEGDPTTMVYADDLSAESIFAAIRAGRTVVKLQGPGDPMVELTSTGTSGEATFTAHVTGGAGQKVRFVVDGTKRPSVDVTSDPFDVTLSVDAPARVRAEVLVGGFPRTITSHIFLTGGSSSKKGCGCSLDSRAGAASIVPLLLGSLALLASRRRRRD